MGDELIDELGHAIPALETLQRLAKACASIGAQLGLAPATEYSMRRSIAADVSNSPWLMLANHKDERAAQVEEVVTPSAAPAASTPEPEPAANGTPRMRGFTSPA